MTLSLVRRTFAPLVVGLSSALLAAGCGGEKKEEEEPPPAPVHVKAAEKKKLAGWTELLGTTQPLPDKLARVSAPVGGYVVSVLDGGKVKEGDLVKGGPKGPALVKLDDRVARANRDKLKATVAEMAEQKKQAENAVELANIEVKRLEDLGTSGELPLASKVELDKARVARKDALSRLEAMTPKLAATNADLAAAEAQLEFYTLRPPINGRLGLVHVVPGQALTPGTVVAEVVNLDEVEVLCSVPPRTAARLDTTKKARLNPDSPADGRVVFVAEQAQAEGGNFVVKVRFPNPKEKLRANQLLRIEVQTEPERERLVIPEEALLEDEEPPTVMVVAQDKEGKAIARRLEATVGVREKGLVEIKELEDPKTHKKVELAGLQFVTEGVHGLHDDDKIKVEDEKEKEKEKE